MKKILVTGASGGMGKAICSLLTDKGYRVYGMDYREDDTVKADKFFQTAQSYPSFQKLFPL